MLTKELKFFQGKAGNWEDYGNELQQLVDQWLKDNPGYQPIQMYFLAARGGGSPAVAGVIFEKVE